MIGGRSSSEEDLEVQYRASLPSYKADGDQIHECLDYPVHVATCKSELYAKMFANAINVYNGAEDNTKEYFS